MRGSPCWRPRRLAPALIRPPQAWNGGAACSKLVGVEASDTRFGFADLSRADLSRAILRGADFTRAILAGSALMGADLRRATLFRADLRGADLTGADLTGANLSGALLGGARWMDGQRICAAASVGSCQ